jgi:cell division protein FtsQ
MWDNPRLLHRAANFLAAVALLALLYAGLQLLLRSPLFPLREIVVAGALQHTTRAEVEAATRGRVAANFFAVELGEVRAALEALPWVRRVQVRRVWPDRLDVAIEEHVALAHWGEGALVNTHGERFAARSDAALPWFTGPAGTEAELARRFARFGQIVAPLGWEVERVVLTPRFAWQLGVRGGPQIVLGRDGAEPAEARLARFVAVYPETLGRIAGRHAYVDLRYPNGFALRIPEAKG